MSSPSRSTAWSEDSLHRVLARGMRPRGLVGSRGHDAAVLRALTGRPVVCTDQTIEGVHYEPDAPVRKVGHKAVARTLSDLAATAAAPRAVLLGLAAPAEREERHLRQLLAAVRRTAQAYGADLVGGDLAAREGPLSLTVTALGELAGRRRPPGRDRARPGQVLLLTGPVGGSGLGRHLLIEPRLAEGRALFDAGATALMDVSDGLAWDAFRLARSSGVRLELDLAAVPLHRDAVAASRRDGRSPLDHALHDGEDHELLACVPQRAVPALVAKLPGVVPVGRVREGRGLVLVEGGRSRAWRPTEGGWKHGG